MSLFTKLANAIFSPVDAAGNPRSVENIDAQRWGTEVERVLAVFQAGGGIIFPDKATADTSLNYQPNQMAWVMGGDAPGVYRKVGTSGSGSWVRLGSLPYSVIPMTNAGAGTANAIVATPSLPLPSAPGAALLTVNIIAANSGNVTINGKPLRTNTGNEIAAGGLAVGAMLAFLDLGDHYRLLSDQASASLVAAAEAAADRAEVAAGEALAAAASVNLPPASENSVVVYDDDAEGQSIPLGPRAAQKMRTRILRERNIWDYLADDPSVPGATNDAWDLATAEMVGLSRPGTLVVPEYLYQLTRTLKTPAGIPFTVQCAGGFATRFIAHASGNWGSGEGQSDIMIGPPNASEVSALRILNAPVLIGNDLVDYGIRFDRLTHSIIENPEITGTNQWAIKFNGYCNTIREPRIHECAGSGIGMWGLDALEGVGNNNINVEGGIIYHMGGIGIRASDGWGINICGVGIEDCAMTGVVASNVDALNVTAGYFETNGQAGFPLAGGGETVQVHADIMLLSRTMDLFMNDRDKGCRAVVIEGNTFTPYGAYNHPEPSQQDCIVFGFSADDSRATNNRIRGLVGETHGADALKGFLGLYNNGFRGKTNSLVLEQNTRNDVVTVGAGLPSFAYDSAHNISNRFAKPYNLDDNNFLSYSSTTGSTGFLRNSGAKLAGFDMWSIGPGDRIWTRTHALPPHLRGKYVRLAAMYVVQETGSGLWMGLVTETVSSQSHDGTIGETSNSAAEPYRKSVILKTDPSDTEITIQVRYAGAGSVPVQIAGVSLSEVGVSLEDALAITPQNPPYAATSAPSEGTWRFGTRVANTPPSTGQPKAWVQTVTGAPSFVSEGNL